MTAGTLIGYFFILLTEVLVFGGVGFALGVWVRGRIDAPLTNRR
jgi:hypothetical protein